MVFSSRGRDAPERSWWCGGKVTQVFRICQLTLFVPVEILLRDTVSTSGLI